MLSKFSWARAAAVIAGANLAVPQLMTYAAEPAAKAAAGESARTPRTKPSADVLLTASGEFTGKVVTAEGTAIDGASVTLKKNGKVVAQTTADTNGRFSVSDLSSGVYLVSAGSTNQTVRVWQPDAAPPTAKASATIVQGQVVRGQDEWDYFETDEMVIAGIATAGLIVGIAALVEADDDDNNGPASP